MSIQVKTFFAAVLTMVMVLGLSGKADAQVRVTVGGMTYDITANLGSFATVQSGVDLRDTNNAPWYTGSLFSNGAAIAFRDAWVAANDTSAIPAGSELAFVYDATLASFTDFAGASNIGGTLSSSGNLNSAPDSATTFSSRTLYFASATLVEVPEINGAALAQMLLVLSVGYLMLVGRRRLLQA